VASSFERVKEVGGLWNQINSPPKSTIFVILLIYVLYCSSSHNPIYHHQTKPKFFYCFEGPK